MSARIRLSLLLAVLTIVPSVATATTITIVNKDDPGVGLNDPTPAAPVGGNSGTTLGQQRQIAFQYAADLWAAKINSPFNIKITARFGPLTPCGPTSGVIGGAGPTDFVASASLPEPDTFYPIALASALLNTDLAVGYPDDASVDATFNSNIGTAGCLSSSHWYLGLDGNEIGNDIDLVSTLLHEFGHGLGFSGVFDVSSSTNPSGAFPSNTPDIYSFFTRDNTLGLYWNMMSNAQRLSSKVNTGNVVWDATNTNGAAVTVLSGGKDGTGHAKLFIPNPVQPGSSLYHFDTSATPNQIMEPAINHDLGPTPGVPWSSADLDTPNDLVARFMQDVGWPQPVALAQPTNLTVTSATATTVNLSWTAASGATSYHVYRSNDGSTYTQRGGNIACCSYADAATSGNAYLFKVRSFNGSTESADSNKDLGYAFTFTDPSITVGSTKVKRAHITELRTGVDAVRQQLLGLGAASYTTDPTITVGTTTVKANHILELRAFLDAARSSLGLPAISYTNTITAMSSPIRRADITDLRGGLQ